MDPSPIWTANGGRALAGGPAIGDSVIALQNVHRHLTLLSRLNGNRIWRKNLRGSGVAGPFLTGQLVITATGGREGRVYAYRIETGRKAWDRELGPVSPPLAIADSLVFAGTEQGVLVALDQDNGQVRWRREFRSAITTGPTVAGADLVLATREKLYRIDRLTGETRASRELPGALITAPAVTHDRLIYTSPDGFIAAFDQSSLELRWKIEVEEPIFGGAVVARDTVFAVSISGKVWSIALTEQQSASYIDLGTPVRASPAPIREGLLVGTIGGELLLISPTDPAPTWHVRVDGPIEQQPIVADGELIFVDGSGRIHAWR